MLRKKTVQRTVFADVATSVSEAIGAGAPGQNPLSSTSREARHPIRSEVPR